MASTKPLHVSSPAHNKPVGSTAAAAGHYTDSAALAACNTLNNESSKQKQQRPVTSPIGFPKKISNGPPKKMMTNLPKRPPVDIEFDNVSYSVAERSGWFQRQKSYKTILKGVSGKFKSGDLTAIMGPSGAGKSTLMNIMAGYKTSNVVGDISINNKTRNLRKFRKMSCYIMQDDCLSPHLTVGEAMDVAANLKLGEKTSKEEKELVKKEILDTLGLTECLKTRTNMISGGQRKRLAIALELVNNPPVMFLDEPTSGLDSSSCLSCIQLLKELASEGRTIVCTIHQPSAKIFEMFDKLVMLAEGQIIYRGSTKGLVPFLSSMELQCPSYHNPADFIMEVASGDYGQFIEKLVTAVQTGKCSNMSDGSPKGSSTPSIEHASTSKGTTNELELAVRAGDAIKINIEESEKINLDGVHASKRHSQASSTNLEIPGDQECKNSLLGSNESVDDHNHTFPTSTWTQFRILFLRTFFSIIRDETLTKLRIISHLFIGLLIGGLYWDIGDNAGKVYNNSAMLFFCMLFSMFTAMMPTVMTFPLEMTTFKREHLNYWYSMKSYYMAKVMADMPFQIIYPLIYVIIVYFMTSQPLDIQRLAMFLTMCILTSLVAQSLGLVIGCACDVQSAVYLGPITTIPILLFSGFFVNLDNIPLYMQWLSYVAYVRYGFEGTMLAIYGFDREPLECHDAYCHFKYPKKFLEELDLAQGVFWIDVVSLLGFFIGLRLIGYFVLRFKMKSEK